MNYWQNYMNRRTDRRRILAAGVGTMAGAALLAACGSSNETQTKRGDGQGLLDTAQDTSAKATQGGIWTRAGADELSFDPLTNGSIKSVQAGIHAYSRLLKYKTGTRDHAPTGDVEGDAATTWEMSPDKMQITFKLRQGMKFDERAPTNGRLLTSADVMWSWDTFAAMSPSRGQIVNSIDPGSPITSLTAPDDQTVVVKLAFPMAPILQMLAYNWYLVVMPVEADGKFNAKSDMRGTGPWMLMKYTPSVSVQYRRNPNFYMKDRPFLDGIDTIVLPDYPSALAQFEAGKLWSYEVKAQDILRTKRDHPKMVLLRDAVFTRNNPWALGFSGLSNQAFFDQRVRQAVSMLLDREALLELSDSPSVFIKEGFDVPTRWHSHISAGEDALWVDPKGKDMGDGAKYFAHDIAEAKKLLKAAGYESLDTTLVPGDNTDIKREELASSLLTDGGMNAKIKVVDYATDYSPNYLGGAGGYQGMATLRAKVEPDIDGQLASKYLTTGRNTYIRNEIPKVNDLVLAQRKEFDREKRIALIKQIQRELAIQMPAVPLGGLSLPLTIGWPWFGNRGAIVDWTGSTGGFAYETTPHYWYDKSKQDA
jgi:peptide/nickel transport system substrate-binding protein